MATNTDNPRKRKVHFQPKEAVRKQKLLNSASSSKNNMEEWFVAEKQVDPKDLGWYGYLVKQEAELAREIGGLTQAEYDHLIQQAMDLLRSGAEYDELTRDALGTFYTPPSQENKRKNLAGATVRILRFETVTGVEYPTQFSEAWCQRLISGSTRPYWVDVPVADYINPANWN
jgi:hypothetical protein